MTWIVNPSTLPLNVTLFQVSVTVIFINVLTFWSFIPFSLFVQWDWGTAKTFLGYNTNEGTNSQLYLIYSIPKISSSCTITTTLPRAFIFFFSIFSAYFLICDFSFCYYSSLSTEWFAVYELMKIISPPFQCTW